MKPGLLTKPKRGVDACKAFLHHAAFRILDDIIVHREADVVKTPGGDHLKVLFGDEAVQALLAVVALGQPAAEIDALIKTGIL